MCVVYQRVMFSYIGPDTTHIVDEDGWIPPNASAGVPSNTGRSTGAVESVVIDFRNLPNGKRP